MKDKKEFNIEVIASVVEVCYLANPNDVYEFCSFVMGEDVHPGNIYKYWNYIDKVIKIQYPEFKRNIFLWDEAKLKPHQIMEVITQYRENFGRKLTIKSLKNEEIKRLMLK